MSSLRAPDRIGDAAGRLAALTDLHRTLAVEAGAGSGKTSLMAGRVVMLLAAGAPPRSIAAITFTVLAAADLSARIRSFLVRLLAGEAPPELAPALPDALDDRARANLTRAYAELDDLTSTTIHGFCQELIRPYPVESAVDPGARIIDEAEAELLFADVRDRWLMERLGAGGDPEGAIASMLSVDLGATLDLVDAVIDLMRLHSAAAAPLGADLAGAYRAFRTAAEDVESAIGPDAPAEARPFALGAAELRAHLEPHALKPPALALAALTLPRTHLHLESGDGYRTFRTKGAWEAIDTRNGAARHRVGRGALDALATAEAALVEAAACAALGALVEELGGLLTAFDAAKRRAAALDFDDLLVRAEQLLRSQPLVRRALQSRYRHVLVDEFQDTDPLQARILWLLCGDEEPWSGDPSAAAGAPRASAAPAAATGDPFGLPLRPGALFVVGDPKQSIYRFRGADIDAYRRAREAIARSEEGAVLRISTNFRSLPTILGFVNERFMEPLSAAGQPGFEALAPWRSEEGGEARVYRLSVRSEPELVPAAAERRDLEAAAVAEAVACLIGSYPLPSSGGAPCGPGDVALLAPTGSDLWRFERALEARGLAVTAQASKGFYQRQEVQDLIALTRALADPRDTLALGALLRGPLVGCSDETLLDVSERLRGVGVDHGRLSIDTDPELVGDATVARVLHELGELSTRSATATPYRVLREGVARLRIRAALRARHPAQADRAYANVERFLELASPFGVRGMSAFARMLRQRWNDAELAVEGRPDAVGDAVTLITVHSSKGLEWPVVLPINTFGEVRRRDPPVLDRRSHTLHARVLGRRYAALEVALEREREAEAQERVRLWYVAATRARDLLVLPTPAFAVDERWWCRVVGLAADQLPELPVPPAAGGAPARRPVAVDEEGEPAPSAEAFAEGSARIAGTVRTLEWRSPSRTREDEEPPVTPPRPRAEGSDDRVDTDPWPVPAPLARGRILHALMQEVLGGELEEDERALARRAGELVGRMGIDAFAHGAVRLRSELLAADVLRGLVVPEVAALRGALVPELPVYAFDEVEGGAAVTVGIADAVAFADDGRAQLVVDWKSDVEPPADRVAHYVQQVRRYLEVLGATRGLLVFLTDGSCVEVRPAA